MFAATLPVDTAGIIRAANEIQFKPKIIGGAMLGLLVTGIKQQLGPMINGYISNEFYIPAPSLQFAGTKEMMDEYQKRAPGLGIDPLGYTYPPYAYAAGQILAQAVTATKSLNDDALADYIRKTKFDTVIGPIAFGPDGEWTTAAHHLHPVPGRDRRRHGPVHGLDAPGRRLSAAIQDRRTSSTRSRRRQNNSNELRLWPGTGGSSGESRSNRNGCGTMAWGCP